jgi:5-methyltetrahydrofolate--homocysteine methyltransferase
MERQGLKLPLLIGGATTSKAHTAVKIAPALQPAGGPRPRRLARRAGGQQPDQPEEKAFREQIREEYDRVRAQHAGQTANLFPSKKPAPTRRS